MMKSGAALLLAALSLASLAACGNTPPANTGGDTSGGGGAGGGSAVGGDTLDAQVTQGKALYADNCALCHGVNGEGKTSPALIGKAALPADPPATAKQRKVPFKTAADVNAFSSKTMPTGSAGTLKDTEYWAITAYILKTTGTDLGGKKLDASTAGSINLR
jgi:mono/diheme cytochrome c family protein